MKKIYLLFLAVSIAFSTVEESFLQSGDSLTYGGTKVSFNSTDCSPDNSSDGKSLAIAVISMASASSCIIQFGLIDPAPGTYTTIVEEPINPGQVIVGVGGDTYGGTFVALGKQSVIVTTTGGKYKAVFKDLVLVDLSTQTNNNRKLSGSLSCN